MKMRLYLLISAFLIIGVGPWKATFALESVVLNQQPIGSSNNTWIYVLDAAHQGWLAYYAETDNLLYVRRPDATEVDLGVRDRERYQSGLAVAPTDRDVAVLWRDKLPAKALYFLPGVGSSGSPSQPLLAADEATEPLTRLQLSHQDGVTYLLWLGEAGLDVRLDAASPTASASEQDQPQTRQSPYHLYFRYTEDHGKTFSPVERVLSGYYPTWIVDEKLIPVFSWYPFEGQLSLVMRVFDRIEKRFGPPTQVVQAPPMTPLYTAFESGGHWFVLWVGQYGDNLEQHLLEGVVSQDQGKTWKRFAFESLRGLDYSRLDTASDGRGHILISVSGSWRFRDADPKAKEDIYVIRSTNNGATWNEPYRPRADELSQFQARDPSAVFGTKPGSAMLVWEDWRDIRPGIYVQFSNDYGATWSNAAALDSRPSIGLGQDFRNKTAFGVGDRYQIIAKRYRDANFRQFDLLRYEVTPAEVQQQAAEDARQKQERMGEARLRERVADYWQAMQDEDWVTTYAINDPFFRAKMPFNTYRSSRDLIKYHSYELLELNRENNIAHVRGRFEASIPEFMLRGGQPYGRDRQPYEKTETWLFVDGDWHREYHEEAQDIRFTLY